MNNSQSISFYRQLVHGHLFQTPGKGKANGMDWVWGGEEREGEIDKEGKPVSGRVGYNRKSEEERERGREAGRERYIMERERERERERKEGVISLNLWPNRSQKKQECFRFRSRLWTEIYMTSNP